MNSRFLPILLVCVALFGFGCGDDDAPATKPTCDEIVEACHEVDPGTGPIHDCHENAEAESATEAICAAASTNCLAICAAAAADAGADEDGGDDEDAGATEDAGAEEDAGAVDSGAAADAG
jgi:hypothetical protein